VLRALYVDLDGTLLGPGGSLLAGADGSFSLDGIRALQACARAGAEVVLYSGRREASVFEDARLIGQRSFIFELGCGLVLDGELEWLTDGLVPSREQGTIYEQIGRSGAPDLLLGAFAGRLEYHTPWSAGREVSHLFRGDVELSEATRLLEAGGFGWLRLVDNGVLAAHGVPIDGDVFGLAADRVHAYHLIPAGASKARAVARHMQARGYSEQEVIAVGDSREDMTAAAVVGAFWLVANGLERDPSLRETIAAAHGAVRVAAAGYGAGVYEAVVTTLAGG
jgi:hydroxymethylpyrimidine pyrophosphatase-like HAD family hydrolase